MAVRARACRRAAPSSVTGRPVARWIAASSSRKKPGPIVACMTPCPASPSAAGERRRSPRAVAARLGTGRPGVADVRRRLRGREAERAGARAPRRRCARMRRDLVGGRRALGRLLAHHVESHRRVADQRADVDRGAAALDRVEVLREGLERPVARRARRGARRATCPRRSRACAGSARGAPDGSARCRSRSCPSRRGDAVPRRDRQHAVPEHLRVVVRVDVDEAGRDDAAVGVDRGRAGRVPRTSPSAAMRPPRIPTSPRRRGAPVPSTSVPPRIRRSNCSLMGTS